MIPGRGNGIVYLCDRDYGDFKKAGKEEVNNG